MKNNIIAAAVFFLASVGLHAQIDRSKQPEPGPAPKINLENPETFKLDNGLKVLVVEDHKLPRVSMTLTLDNPPHAEGDKVGVSSLMGSLLGKGTSDIPKDEFNEEIDYLGANVNYFSSGASASSLSKYFPRVLELMSKGAIDPNFTQEEFEKEKQRTIEGIKSMEKDVASNASQIGAALAYGKNHPYGEFPTVESIQNIDLNNVKAYYNNYFSPENAYLVVVGDVKTRKVKKLVKKHFGEWEERNVPKTTIPEVNNPQYTQVNFVDFPNAVQSEVSLTNTVKLQKNHPDFFPALIANKILGGGGEARLFLNLREDKGYTYGAYSSLGNDEYVSRFVASASVRNAITDSAVVAFLDELHRIRNEKVSAEELQNAKNKYTGNFVMALEQPSTVARYALDIETENLPKDFYQNYLEQISAVTAEDVQRVAQKYFKTDNMRIVVAGKGSEVAKKLENLEYKGKDIPVIYYDKKANKTEKPVFSKALPQDVTVESVYEDYIKAIGGEDAAEEVETVAMKGTANVQGMTLNVNIKRTKDGKALQEISMNGMTVNKDVFNGETGYRAAQGQKMPYTKEEIAEAKEDAAVFPELEEDEEAELIGIEQVNGKDAYVVKVSDELKNFYSTETGLKVQSVKTREQGGQTFSSTTGYNNYKEVEGVKFPFELNQTVGPQNVTIEFQEIKVNEGVSEADFQ